MRLLVDVNVCLDVLLDRAPFSEASSRIWCLVEEGQLEGLVPAHGVTTIHYLVAGTRDRATARRFVGDLLRVFKVAAVDETVIQRALGLRMRDFEDAVCAALPDAEVHTHLEPLEDARAYKDAHLGLPMTKGQSPDS